MASSNLVGEMVADNVEGYSPRPDIGHVHIIIDDDGVLY